MTRAVRKVVVEAAAKVNIGWQVGSLRDDGFHAVSGLMQTINVCDRIEVARTDPGDPDVVVHVPGRPELESDDNLVVKAARVIGGRAAKAGPVRITIHKAIPVAAGLGGGSADAAAALLGLSVAWGTKLSGRDLFAMAAEIGSDVAPILRGGLVHASGRGELVRSLGSFTDGHLIVGVSAEPISAADAYRTLDGLPQRSSGAEALHHNDLEEAACTLLPALRGRLGAMREAAGVAFVSGSGPTVVGVVRTGAEAEAVRARVAGHFEDVLLATPSPWGVRVHLGS